VPVFEQTYRRYDGKAKASFRWRTMVRQELRVISRSWAFRGLFGLGMLHAFLRFIQVLAFDSFTLKKRALEQMLQEMANGPLAGNTYAIDQIQKQLVWIDKYLDLFQINASTFFDFIRIQSPIVFITMILAGSGMICNDARNNLMEVYFSKPLNWRDYVFGKCVALSAVGFLMTAAPALFLIVFHNLVLPGADTFQDSLFWTSATVFFSMSLVLPCTFGILASSASIRSQRFAGIAVFMVLFGDLTIGTTLQGLMNEPNYLILAFPVAINHVGQHLFQQRELLYNLPWKWSVSYIVGVCLITLSVICFKVRRAEVG